MKIKVCGMREPKNIEALAALPIDMIGFIFYPKSPRFVGDGLAKWLSGKQELLSGKERVGVFVNAEVEDILNRVHDFQLDYVQLHGDESPEYCELLRTLWGSTSMRKARLIKAFRIEEGFDFSALSAYSAHCAYFLFDTKGQQYGGTGEQFNWELLDRYQGITPFLLSGGIGLDSVEAIRKLKHPQLTGLDLNSRFELEPGVKDIYKIRQFIDELNPEHS